MAKAKVNKTKKVTTKRNAGLKTTPKAGMKKLKTKSAGGFAISSRMHKALDAKATEVGVPTKKFIDAGLKKLAGI